MTRFLTRLFEFAVVLALLASLSAILNAGLFRTVVYRAPRGTQVLIAGHSQTVVGLDPGIIGNAVNISQNAEPFYMTYHKIEETLNRNEGISVLVIPLGPATLARFNERKLRDPRWASFMMHRYYPIAPLIGIDGVQSDLGTWAVVMAQRVLTPSRDYVRTMLRHRQLPYIGEFDPHFGNGGFTDRNFDELIERHFPDGSRSELSAVTLAYLDRVLALTDSLHVTPLFVSMPVHPAYYEAVPNGFRVALDSLSREIEAHPSAEYLNLLQLPLADSLFYDWNHLNRKGATVVSRLVARHIRETCFPGL